MKSHFTPDETLKKLEPANMGLTYCSAQRLELDASLELQSSTEELCLVCIEGECTYRCNGNTGTATLGDMLYVPIETAIQLDGSQAVLARFGAPCTQKYSFGHIRFSEVDADERHKIYGKTENGTRRDVWNFIDETFPSGRFLTGICYSVPGGWTAWPPHEHGKEREEVYVYFDMGNAFGVQCVYDELDTASAYVVQNGHLVAIPHGYHPNVGCPAGSLRYVYCMVSTTEGDRNFMDLRTQKIYGDKLE